MKQEDKELLLKDLSARLPYGVYGLITFHKTMGENSTFKSVVDGKLYDRFANLQDSWYDNIPSIKPYLRPMSSMTEEERKELEKITYHTFEYKKGERDIWTKSYHKNYLFDGAGELYGAGEPINMLCSSELCTKLIDWLNMHHFDYRHLIERGLALKAKEGMYKK